MSRVIFYEKQSNVIDHLFQRKKQEFGLMFAWTHVREKHIHMSSGTIYIYIYIGRGDTLRKMMMVEKL